MISRLISKNNLAKACAVARYAAITSGNKLAAGNLEITRELHDVFGDVICPGQLRGIDHLRDPRINKGLAFTLEERQVLGIHGLQPGRFKTQEEQMELCKISINRYKENINKYLYLADLHDRNERLFYRFIIENIAMLMPIIYTPTVGLACQKYGLIYRRPRGLFVTINDRGHVFDVIKNWPEPDVRAICVTDGERILGLGDLGASGMGIPVGKLALYTALAGVKPHQCLPVLIDVGTNNQDQLEDPLYIGLRQKRVTGDQYVELMDEFMEAVVKRYGQNTLIQFEDFGNHNAFLLLERYLNKYCTFNDDIQGTAGVVVGGLYASQRVTGKTFKDHTFLFVGAGEANLGISMLVVKALMEDGLSREEAIGKVFMVDVNGLLSTKREEGDLSGLKKVFAKDLPPEKSLLNIVNTYKPSVMVGASAQTGLFTNEILTKMGEFNDRPLIFALSNPTSKAECTAKDAYVATEGRAIFASGSPFAPVEYEGRTIVSGQGNNAYIFPGVALGVIATGTHHVSENMFLVAAQEMSKLVDQKDLEAGSIYPSLKNIKEVSIRIAIAVVEMAFDTGLASYYPEPQDKRKWLEEQLYDSHYTSSMPISWPWPETKEEFKVRSLADSKLITTTPTEE